MEREATSLEERVAEARRRSLDASRAAYEAQEALTRLELEAATARARAKLECALAQGALSPELHGELVCDAAREHGATCARAKAISEVSWRAVRVAVASVVERLAEVTRERDQARERLADALRDRDAADAAFAACARAAECVYEDGTLHDVRTTVAQIEQLVACANTRCTCAQLAAEDEAEAEHDRAAIAEEERDEARQLRDEAAKEAQATVHEAQEQGARWALARAAQAAGDGVDALRVERVCAEARAKGGE